MKELREVREERFHELTGMWQKELYGGCGHGCGECLLDALVFLSNE